MKKSKIVYLLAFLVSIVTVFSCEKTDEFDNSSETFIAQIIGTYHGTLENSVTNQHREATMSVSIVNDSLISMHCTANSFDTTFTMQIYQHYDSIMLCHTGQDFYAEYGHEMNNYDFCFNQQAGWTNDGWMNNHCMGGGMMGNNPDWGNSPWAGDDHWNAWTNHLNTQHKQSDMHHGGFDPSLNSCNYEFHFMNNNTEYSEIFHGLK